MKQHLVVAAPIATAVAALVLISGQALSAGPKTDPHKDVRVTPEAARAEVARRVPGAGTLTYDGTRDRPGVRVHVFENAKTTAYVDVSDGHIAMLSVATPVAASGAVTHDGAITVAQAFLASMESPTEGLDATVSDATGSGIPGFTVSFVRHKGEIVLPDYRMVEIDAASGGVISMIDVRRPYVDPAPPTVTAAQATDIAVRAAAQGSPLAPVLMVSWDAAGNQQLLWTVPITAATSATVIMVDAYTGAVMPVAAP